MVLLKRQTPSAMVIVVPLNLVGSLERIDDAVAIVELAVDQQETVRVGVRPNS